jgi:hypothetical protein
MPKRVRHEAPVPRKILGVSLPPEIANEVKAEAAKRDITVRELFLELWAKHRGRTAKANA